MTMEKYKEILTMEKYKEFFFCLKNYMYDATVCETTMHSKHLKIAWIRNC